MSYTHSGRVGTSRYVVGPGSHLIHTDFSSTGPVMLVVTRSDGAIATVRATGSYLFIQTKQGPPGGTRIPPRIHAACLYTQPRCTRGFLTCSQTYKHPCLYAVEGHRPPAP